MCHFKLVTSVARHVCRCTDIYVTKNFYDRKSQDAKNVDAASPTATSMFRSRRDVWSTFWNFATRAHSVTYRNWYYIYRGTSLQLPPAYGETFPVSSIYNIFIFLLTRSRNIFTFTRYLRGARISGLCDDTTVDASKPIINVAQFFLFFLFFF